MSAAGPGSDSHVKAFWLGGQGGKDCETLVLGGTEQTVDSARSGLGRVDSKSYSSLSPPPELLYWLNRRDLRERPGGTSLSLACSTGPSPWRDTQRRGGVQRGGEGSRASLDVRKASFAVRGSAQRKRDGLPPHFNRGFSSKESKCANVAWRLSTPAAQELRCGELLKTYVPGPHLPASAQAPVSSSQLARCF